MSTIRPSRERAERGPNRHHELSRICRSIGVPVNRAINMPGLSETPAACVQLRKNKLASGNSEQPALDRFPSLTQVDRFPANAVALDLYPFAQSMLCSRIKQNTCRYSKLR